MISRRKGMNGMPHNMGIWWPIIIGGRTARALALKKVKFLKKLIPKSLCIKWNRKVQSFLIATGSKNLWTWTSLSINAFKENLLRQSILKYWETLETSTIRVKMVIMEAWVPQIKCSWWMEMETGLWDLVLILIQMRWLGQLVVETLLQEEPTN